MKKVFNIWIPILTLSFFHIEKPITEFQPAMEKKGVLVGRPFPPYTDWCRLSMATPDEMGRFIEGFNSLL